MKKILIIIFITFISNCNAEDTVTNFTIEKFKLAQNEGKTVIVFSWNKFCSTCAKQKPILKEAEKDFNSLVFLNYEQTKYPAYAKYLNINYWTTIAIYKENKQISKAIGLQEKEEIYSLINKAL